ncbi:hypothetical protein [Cryobacterium frigoriphilum]|nr:hypothetical protein [Cryobacterium frigoriphilum]
MVGHITRLLQSEEIFISDIKEERVESLIADRNIARSVITASV